MEMGIYKRLLNMYVCLLLYGERWAMDYFDCMSRYVQTRDRVVIGGHKQKKLYNR